MERYCAHKHSIFKCWSQALCCPLYTGGWEYIIYVHQLNALLLHKSFSCYFIGRSYKLKDEVKIRFFFPPLFVASGEPLSWLPDQKSSLSGHRQFKYFPLPDHLGSHRCPHGLFKGRFQSHVKPHIRIANLRCRVSFIVKKKMVVLEGTSPQFRVHWSP